MAGPEKDAVEEDDDVVVVETAEEMALALLLSHLDAGKSQPLPEATDEASVPLMVGNNEGLKLSDGDDDDDDDVDEAVEAGAARRTSIFTVGLVPGGEVRR